MKEHNKDMIPTYQDVIPKLSEMLSKNHSLSALYIDCSRISKIEKVCGKKIYLDIMQKVHRVFLEMRGRQIRNDDLIVFSSTGNEEFFVFLDQKREDKEFCPSDLETLCMRVSDYLNDTISPITFHYLRGGPKICVGYAVIIHNPLMREERLLNKLIEDSKQMSTYYEFKRVMRYKEKLQELILKEGIRTIYQPIVNFAKN
jgi:hypothetical protein